MVAAVRSFYRGVVGIAVVSCMRLGSSKSCLSWRRSSLLTHRRQLITPTCMCISLTPTLLSVSCSLPCINHSTITGTNMGLTWFSFEPGAIPAIVLLNGCDSLLSRQVLRGAHLIGRHLIVEVILQILPAHVQLLRWLVRLLSTCVVRCEI